MIFDFEAVFINSLSLQVNLAADSFESPLTLAACGGHELAVLFLERGANTEEVNDEGYIPLLEARASLNAITDTRCENGHTDVADLLLQYG